MALRIDAELKSNLKNLVYLIEAFDGYRRGRGTAISTIEKAYYSITLSLPLKWKPLKRTMETILEFPTKNPRMRKLYRRIYLSRFFMNVGLAVVLTGAALSFFLGRTIFSLIILALGVVSLYTAVIMHWMSIRKIYKYYDDHLDKLRPRAEKMKEAAQTLINILRRELGKYHIDPVKYLLHLYNTDYDGIEIVAKPRVFRKTYLCMVKPIEEE